MANKSFIVRYLIQAKDAFSRDANRAAKSFSKLDKNSRQAAKGFARTSSAFARGFKNMAAAAIAFFSIRGLIERGAEFQDAMADLSSITGAAGENLKFLRDESLRLGKASITSQAQVATAFKLIASAKSELLKDPKGLSRVTEQVLLLANASGIDLTIAANTTTQALNQFGAGADQAERFVNVLAAGAKIGASEVAETGVALIKSGAVAKQVGVSFEELNAAIQVLAKGGVKAEVAGTGLKTALLRLEKTGVKRLSPSVVGLSKALANLDAMGLSTVEMQKLFGDEAIVIGSILSSNAALVKDWTRQLTGTNTAQEQAAIRLSTFRKQAQKMKLIIDDALIKTFLRLEPVLTTNIKQFGQFLSTIRPDQINAFADALKIVAGALKTIGFFAKEALGILKGVGETLGQTAAAIASFDFSQFDLSNAFRIGSPSLAGNAGRVDVGVNVGLDDGLKQTGAPTVKTTGTRRTDVGAGTAGL